MLCPRFGLFLLLAHFLSGAAYCGTIRYNLPELLGEHRFDGTTQFGGIAQIDTPFGFYSVEQARLVIEGSVQPGKARGDGIMREPIVFDLEPFAQSAASFKRMYVISATPTIGSFSFDEIYNYPFVPETTPLPNPNGYPPITFSVGLGLSLSFSTRIPSEIGLGPPFLDAMEGIIVDVPIIADISEAYVEFSGASIVPEPSMTVLALASCLSSILCLSRVTR